MPIATHLPFLQDLHNVLLCMQGRGTYRPILRP